jgi:HPt (histidine-containing phosphotransfer) domain-containing protein
VARDSLDVQRLKEMTGDDPLLAAEVLELFCDQAIEWRACLDSAAVPPGWVEVCHSIKGAAVGLGALGLGEACSTAEKLGRAHGPDAEGAALCLDRVRELLVASTADMGALRLMLRSEGAFPETPWARSS